MKKTREYITLLSIAMFTVFIPRIQATKLMQVKIINQNLMPTLDDKEEMTEQEAEMAAGVEVQKCSPLWRAISKIGSDTLARFLRLKQSIETRLKKMHFFYFGKKMMKKIKAER